MTDEHPPRKDLTTGGVHPDDEGLGVNRETFLPALVRASTVEPQLRPETWEQLLDPASKLLGEQQWRQLWRACWNLNMQAIDLPFSVAGLLPNPISDSGSGSPEPSA